MEKKTKAIMGVVVAIVLALMAFGVGMPDWIMSVLGIVPEVPVVPVP